MKGVWTCGRREVISIIRCHTVFFLFFNVANRKLGVLLRETI